MITDKNTLKSWFLKGLKPLETNFADWIDSYWHKADQIPTSSIQGLENTLNQKAETAETQIIRQAIDDTKQQIDNIVNGTTPVANAQYTTNLGTPGNSYTKTNLDIAINQKVDKIPGWELMPSPGAEPKADYFLNEQGEYVQGYTPSQIDEKLINVSCGMKEIICRTDEEIQAALNAAEADRERRYVLVLDFPPDSNATLTGSYTTDITIRNRSIGKAIYCAPFQTTGWFTITSTFSGTTHINNLSTENVKIINSDVQLDVYREITQLHIIGSNVRLAGNPKTSIIQKVSITKSTTFGTFYRLAEVIAFQGSNAINCNNDQILEKIRSNALFYNKTSDYVSAFPADYVSHSETPMVYTDECWEHEDFIRRSRIQIVDEYPTDLSMLKDGDIIIKL